MRVLCLKRQRTPNTAFTRNQSTPNPPTTTRRHECTIASNGTAKVDGKKFYDANYLQKVFKFLDCPRYVTPEGIKRGGSQTIPAPKMPKVPKLAIIWFNIFYILSTTPKTSKIAKIKISIFEENLGRHFESKILMPIFDGI